MSIIAILVLIMGLLENILPAFFVYIALAGICDGVIALDGACPVYGLILGIQNANLLKIADHPLDKDELDGVRASYIRDHLPDIKQV